MRDGARRGGDQHRRERQLVEAQGAGDEVDFDSSHCQIASPAVAPSVRSAELRRDPLQRVEDAGDQHDAEPAVSAMIGERPA